MGHDGNRPLRNLGLLPCGAARRPARRRRRQGVHRETKRVDVRWSTGMIFTGGEADGPQTVVDGDNASAPGPMLTLLLAAANCSGADVVSILEKMRVKLLEFRIEVAGERREEDPRRYTAIHLDYHLRGEGLDEARGLPRDRPVHSQVLCHRQRRSSSASDCGSTRSKTWTARSSGEAGKRSTSSSTISPTGGVVCRRSRPATRMERIAPRGCNEHDDGSARPLSNRQRPPRSRRSRPRWARRRS